MKGTLILVRHGKAGTSQPGKDDFFRPLTDLGRTEMTAFLQTVKPHLQSEKLEVWTSPLTRARQTAELFIQALNIEKFTEKGFLANGDLAACLNGLKEQDDFKVACIGHEPYLSAWITELTGKKVKFDKGAVMKIVFEEDGSATLDWKLSPKGRAL